MIQKFYSRGKLLLSGEYFVLHGAKALAIPVNRGQHLEIKKADSGRLEWETYEMGKKIFAATLDAENFTVLNSNDYEKSNFIANIFKAIRTISPEKLPKSINLNFKAHIEFNMGWGLGTSSTLINNMATWCKINPYKLNKQISKGSGYDIACASANSPIIFQNTQKQPIITPVDLNYSFLNNLTLVYLNKKMSTENNIKNFIKKRQLSTDQINRMNALTHSFVNCHALDSFIELNSEHECLVSQAINKVPVKNELFPDFQGSVKSLGAWGGDFVLAASHLGFEKQKEYFNKKNFLTVIPLKSLILK